MRNLRFKRKAKSGEGDDKEKKKRLVTPLAFSAVLKKETSVKSKASN